MARFAICLVFCAPLTVRAEPFTSGDDWIANATVRVRLDRGRLRYARLDETGKSWTELAVASTGATGMGHYLLLGATPTRVTIRRTDGKAELSYRLEGLASQPKQRIWVQYKATLGADSPCVALEMSAASDRRLRMLCFVGPAAGNATGVAPASRYIIHDQSLPGGRYTIGTRDAAGIAGPASRAYTYSRFTATYSHLDGWVVALFGVDDPPAPKPCRAGGAWGGGTGFGRLEIRDACAFSAAKVPELKGLDNIAHYVENGYWQLRNALSKKP